MGRDFNLPREIRYTNAGSFYIGGATRVFDLVLTNRSEYLTSQSQLNGMVNSMARIDVACNTAVNMRIQVTLSCDQELSCGRCAAMVTARDRLACYSTGCACFGVVIFHESYCTGANYDRRRVRYQCPTMNTQLIFPTGNTISMGLYDFDGAYNGVGGYVAKRVTLPRYSVFKTPMRASEVLVQPTSNVQVQTFTSSGQVQFTSTVMGNATDDPFSPYVLTSQQAAKS